MTIQYGLLLLLLGCIFSITVFILLIKFEMNISKDKEKNKDENKILSKIR